MINKIKGIYTIDNGNETITARLIASFLMNNAYAPYLSTYKSEHQNKLFKTAIKLEKAQLFDNNYNFIDIPLAIYDADIEEIKNIDDICDLTLKERKDKKIFRVLKKEAIFVALRELINNGEIDSNLKVRATIHIIPLNNKDKEVQLYRNYNK